MHMADALLSPEVGGTMWVAAGAALAYSAKKLKNEMDDQRVPLMGVLGAFIFAVQMINFSIPGTGSSGHLGGGMILAILLGPYAAFIVMASILTVQSLFFADGGLLALGSNIFNLGIFPCFIAYPLIFKNITGKNFSNSRIVLASIVSAVFALQLGSLFVVLETVLSGISELKFGSFLLVMQPIHFAIGVIEGVITSVVVTFLWKAEPGLLEQEPVQAEQKKLSLKKAVTGLIITTVLTGGVLSWFASSNPDGLEWSISKVTSKDELEAPESGIYSILNKIQKKLSFLPGYDYKKGAEHEKETDKKKGPESLANAGTSISGVMGGIITILFVAIIGFILKKRPKREDTG